MFRLYCSLESQINTYSILADRVVEEERIKGRLTAPFCYYERTTLRAEKLCTTGIISTRLILTCGGC